MCTYTASCLSPTHPLIVSRVYIQLKVGEKGTSDLGLVDGLILVPQFSQPFNNWIVNNSPCYEYGKIKVRKCDKLSKVNYTDIINTFNFNA